MTSENGFTRHFPWLLVFGVIIAGVTNIIATLLAPNTALIADTISDVAAGPYDWIQDIGFYILATGLLATAYVLWRMSGGWFTWKLCALTMLAMAASLILIAAIHEYGDGDKQDAIIHYYAVYTHGIAFSALLLLSLFRLQTGHSGWVLLNVAIMILWVGGSIYFFNMGTSFDGLFERALAALAGGWLILFATQTAWQLGSRPVSRDRLPDMVTYRTR